MPSPNIGSRILLAVLAGMSAASASARVIGEESRSRLDDANQARFSGVGRVTCVDRRGGVRGYSTATVVGDRRTALGVGHFRRLMIGGVLADVPLEQCRFDLFGADRRRIFSSPIEAVRSALPPRVYRRSSYGMPDWSVFRLSRSVPASVRPISLRVLPAGALNAAEGAFMVAYHDSANIPAAEKVYAPDCRPRQVAGHPTLFEHECDTSPGASGGLLFAAGPQGPVAIGMHTAEGAAQALNLGQIFSRELIGALPTAAVEPNRE